MNRFLILAAATLVGCSASDTAQLAPTEARQLVSTTNEQGITLTVSEVKEKGQTLVYLTWSNAPGDSVWLWRQNQSVQPSFIRRTLPNTGSYVDTLPKGKQPFLGYYYQLCAPGSETATNRSCTAYITDHKY